MSDEVSDLRDRLLAGDWYALADPLLPLALLSDPTEWWHEARERCESALFYAAIEAVPPNVCLVVVEEWREIITPGRPAPDGWSRTLRRITDGDHWAAAQSTRGLVGQLDPELAVEAKRLLIVMLLVQLPDDDEIAIWGVVAMDVLGQLSGR